MTFDDSPPCEGGTHLAHVMRGRKALVLWVSLAVTAMVAPACRGGTRFDEPAARSAVEEAFHANQSDGDIKGITFAGAHGAYASIRFGGTGFEATDLYGRTDGRWDFLFGFEKGQRADGACAFGPDDVVRDLYGVDCPPTDAVRAAKADKPTAAALRSALASSPLTSGYVSEGKLTGPCVSRFDPDWAAGVLSFPDTAAPVWFHRSAGTWAVRYSDIGEQGDPPSGDVALSLASCVGYNAARYSDW